MKGLYGCILILSVASLSSFGQVSSIASGDWDNVNTWSCGCVPDSNNGQITILNGHTVTLTSDITISELMISLGGTLTVNSGVNLSSLGFSFVDAIVVNGTLVNNGNINVQDFDYVQVNGTLNNAGTFTDVFASGTENWIFFNSGSTYDHKYTTTAGAIPMATWDVNSTTIISGYTTNVATPSNLGQSFGHFFINLPSLSSSTLSLGGLLSSVNGNFRVVTTNGRPFYLANGGSGYTLNIGGDFIMENGNFFFARNLSSQTIINIAGDLSQASGTLIFANSAGQVTVDLKGDLNKSGGTWSSTLASNLNFTSGGVQTITNNASTGAILNYQITSNTTVVLPGESFLSSTSTSSSLTVDGGSGLRLGSTSASGALQAGATGGNIRIAGTRLYASGSTITYDGSAAQFTGNGHPAGSGVHMIVNNASGVTMTQNLWVTGNLTLASGNLSVSAHTLTLSGNLIPNTNFLVVTTLSNIVINGIGPFGTLATSGSATINDFTLNRTTSGSVTLGSDLTVGGILTQTIGDITLNGHTLTINGPYNRDNGSINVDASSNLIVSGAGELPAAVTFAGDQTLNTLTVSRSGAVLATNSSLTITNLNLSSGTFDNTGTITIATGGVITRTEGSIINNTPAAQTSYDIVYNIATDIVTGSEIPEVSSALRHVTKTGGALLTLNEPLTINGDFTLSNGSFDAASHAINLKGNFIANAVSTLTSSPFTFSGTTSISGGSPVHFGDVLITGTMTPQRNIRINGNLENNGTLNAGTATTTFAGTTAITGTSVSSFNNVVVSSVLTAPAGSMNVAGNFTNNGTFNHNNGTVVFNGTTAVSGTSTTSFFGVSITGAFTAPSTTLNIAGNFSNTGTFNHNDGTLLLNGTTSAQAVTGSFTFNDVNISNPSKVNNNGTIDLIGTLALIGSGALDADGAGSGILTIKSTSVNEGGRIAELGTPGNLTGQVTIERYVNGPQGWRYLSMPLTNGNVGNWQSSFPVTGNFSNPSPAGVDNVTSSTAPSIYYWNSSTQAYVAVGSGGATGSTSLNNLVGYSPYTYRSGDFTISMRGNPRTGNATIPIASSGYALVPNPYPSAIDWDNVNRTGLSSTMSIRVSNGVFASYVAGGLSTNAPYVGWTGEVATGQAFWIESTGATSLNLTESAKTGGQYQFLRQGTPDNYIRIALSSESQRDEALIWFVEGASRDFDPSLDARKMRNGYFNPGEQEVAYLNIASQLDNTDAEYAINAISPLSCNAAINLRVRDIAEGKHTLSFSDIETLSFGYQIVLVDRYVSTETFVEDGFQYEFSVSADSASFANDRFALRFIVPGSVYINSQTPPEINVESACHSDTLSLKIQTQKDIFYEFTRGGALVTEPFAGNGGVFTLDIPKSQLSPGLNEFDIYLNGNKGCERVEYKGAFTYDLVNLDSVQVERDGLYLSSSHQEGNQWFKDGVLIEGATAQGLDVSESGQYSVQVSYGGCTLQSENIEVQVDPLSEQFIKVYPNPSSGKIMVVLPPEILSNLKGISLTDLKGSTVVDHSSNPELLVGHEKTIDLTHVKQGLYMLTITTGTKTYHLKVVRK